MKQPDLPALLAGSMDVRYWRFNAGLMLLPTALLLGCLVPALMLDLLLPAAALIGCVFVITAPLGLHFWNKANRLLRDPERYRQVIGVPVKMEADFFQMIRLDLEVWDGDQKITLTSGPVFNASVMSSRYFGDYFGQQLVLLWDEQGDRLVVLGKRDEYVG
jgi:hypothetical protein